MSTRFFGQDPGSQGVSLEVATNRVLAIIGPIGVREIDILRCLNRMPRSGGGTMKGTITLDGENIMQIDEVNLRRRVGMVFQKPIPFRTCRYSTTLQRDSGSTATTTTNIWPKSSNGASGRLRSGRGQGFPEQIWDEYLGGQQPAPLHRRALFREPRSGPDGRAGERAGSAFDGENRGAYLRAEANYTIAIVTHNMQQAARVSDKTAFFYLGELIEIGETKRIFTTRTRADEDYITGRFG